MILKGNQRSGANQMAVHLLNADDNEHVDVHELRGFVGDDLHSAFHEIYAISRGTRCKQFMFSLSLSPPQNENVPIEVFKNAISQIEKKLGLEDQARAIVFHEKEGRRHAHVVWSRIKVDKMKAINLPHYKLKLRDVSRELYLEHGWKMPQGLTNSRLRDPANFSLAEWQQAKRAGKDAKVLKQAFQDCWAISDSKAAFAHALKERGLYLAKGDRRGFVAVDYQGEVYAIARWVGIKTKDVKAKLGSPKDLPSVDGTKAYIAEKMTGMLEHHIDEQIAKFSKAGKALGTQRKAMVKRQRIERVRLIKKQQTRQIEDNKQRFTRLLRGLKGIWQRITGNYSKIVRQNKIEAKQCRLHDRQERQSLIGRHLDERRNLQRQITQVRQQYRANIDELHKDIRPYLEMSHSELKTALAQRIHERKQIRESFSLRL